MTNVEVAVDKKEMYRRALAAHRMRDPKAILESLPKACMHLMPSRGEPIVLTRGCSGYDRVTHTTTVDEVVTFNRLLGVTPAQAAAMLSGALFGFHVPGADPAYVTELAAVNGLVLTDLESYFRGMAPLAEVKAA